LSLLEGIADLSSHAGAAQRFTPVRMERNGEIRHCQGTVLIGWIARGPEWPDPHERNNVFVLGLDRRISSATGFTNPLAEP
jgi:hypothetical protein